MWRSWIHRRERALVRRDNNRRVLPFEWGVEFLLAQPSDMEPRQAIAQYVGDAVRRSDQFYDPGCRPAFNFADGWLSFPSPIETPYPDNNSARFRFYPARSGDRAVIVVPHWNASREAYAGLCWLIRALGVNVLRMSLPYHDARKPAHLERSDYMVSPNIGRTIQAMRQAILELRLAVDWLQERGCKHLGIVGTSLGSCIAFLAFAHEPRLEVAVCNHISSFFADPVWTGITTRHVREGLEQEIQLEELRRHWFIISPAAFAHRIRDEQHRRVLFIAARYDLSFLPHLSRQLIDACRRERVAHDVAWLPCGHYTSGEFPFNYLTGWLIVSYLAKHLGRSRR